MVNKPTYEELEHRIKDLEKEAGKPMAADKKLKRYQFMVESAHDAIFFKDLESRYIIANNKTLKAFGLLRKDVIGKNDYELMPDPKEAEKNVSDDQIVFETGKPTEVIKHMTGADGKEYWFQAIKVPQFDSAGKVMGLVGIARDISDRKRSEEALKQSEERYRTFINSTSDIVFLKDEQFRHIIINKAYSKYLGRKKQEIIGKTDFVLLPTMLAESCRQSDLNALNADGVVVSEEWDGERFYETRKFPVKLGEGISGIGGYVREITEQKLTEKALRESEARFRNIFENLMDVYFETTLDGVIKVASPSTEDFSGYSLAELIGNKVFMLYQNPSDREGLLKDLDLKGKVRGYELLFKKKNGEPYNVSINADINYDEEGKASGIRGTIRDITQQKKLTEHLQQVQKMESIGTLAGGIAHDFNNLLMGILGRVSLMFSDADSYHPHTEHLKRIEEYVKSATELTKQLLGFARGGKYEVIPIKLNELIKNQSQMFGRTRKEISIHKKFEENLWTVEVDRGQIEQVLLNIFVNAWQAMPGGGNLYIQTEHIVIDENFRALDQVNHGKYVKISITDTGVGMDKATQQRIFEPFFTTKDMGRGTGLGLASAYGIITNHGGLIDVYSEKGRGTTFNIYLPKSDKEVVEQKKPDEGALKGTETVLLVDDEEMIIEVGQAILERLGYNVLIAKSGKETIEIYKKGPGNIDIIVLDMIMPGMNGGETYDKLKEISPDIKVLLSSGYSLNGEATKILERGCNSFIQKPYNMKELSEKIREILDKD